MKLLVGAGMIAVTLNSLAYAAEPIQPIKPIKEINLASNRVEIYDS